MLPDGCSLPLQDNPKTPQEWHEEDNTEPGASTDLQTCVFNYTFWI